MTRAFVLFAAAVFLVCAATANANTQESTTPSTAAPTSALTTVATTTKTTTSRTTTSKTTTVRTTTKNPCVLPNCTRCNATALSVCLRCAPPSLLHQGQCVDACPLTHSSSTSNTTGLRSCVQNFCTGTNCPPAPAVCVRRSENCTSCKPGNFLLDGKCLTGCPSGYKVSNTSSLYKRKCVPRDCPAVFPNCYTCDGPITKCLICKNNHSLYNDHCLKSCPASTVSRGTGVFRRTCLTLPTPTSCTPGQAKCRNCGLGPNKHKCLQCTESYYLLNGVCLAACPLNTIPVTPGVDGSYCKY